MKYQAQVGIEQFVKGKREVRLTPIDQKFDLPEPVGSLLMVAVKAADLKDRQPGDGEFDLPLKDLPDQVIKQLPGAFSMIQGVAGQGDWNLFVRLKAV